MTTATQDKLAIIKSVLTGISVGAVAIRWDLNRFCHCMDCLEAWN